MFGVTEKDIIVLHSLFPFPFLSPFLSFDFTYPHHRFLSFKNSMVEENIFGVKGEGKSGAFMLITKDHKFILKTSTKEERDFLWQLLPYYYQVPPPYLYHIMRVICSDHPG